MNRSSYCLSITKNSLLPGDVQWLSEKKSKSKILRLEALIKNSLLAP